MSKGFTFDDAVHVLGLDDYLRSDDDSGAEWVDYGPQEMTDGYQHTVTIAWDGAAGDAKWYASTFAALAQKHIPGVVVTYTDAQQ